MSESSQYKTRIYSPYKNVQSSMSVIIKCLIEETVFRRELLLNLIKRGLFSEYKRSFVGALWIIFAPLTQIISWTILKKANILNPGDTVVPYPVYILTGTLLWSLFFNTLNSSLTTFSKYRVMLLRVPISVEMFFIVEIALIIIPFFIIFYLSTVIFLFFDVAISTWVILLPMLIIPIVLFGLATGMFFSLFTIISYDLRRIVKALFAFMIFFTPLVYSFESLQSGYFKTVVLLNPLTYLITVPRDLILSQKVISTNGYVVMSSVSLVIFYVSLRIFNFSKKRLLEKIF